MTQYPPPHQPGGPMNYYGQPPAYPPPGPGYGYGGPMPQSGVGIASFILAILAALGVLITFVIMSSLVSEHRMVSREDSEVMAAGCGILASGGLALVGAILGLVGVNQKDRRRGFAVAGLIINLIVVLGIGILMMIGLSRR